METTTTNKKKIDEIKTHARFMSAELLSMSDKHYFHYNGKSYPITTKHFNKIILDIKGMNPLSAIKYLIELVKNKQL